MDAMTNGKSNREALARLNRALVEDILAASDESILTEVEEEEADPAAMAAAARELFEKAALARRKTLLAEAKAAAAADRRRRAGGILSLDALTARQHLRRLLAKHPETARKLTMAARKGKAGDFSDDEVYGLLEDFEDLGILLQGDDPSGDR
jgi:hypothetical protein